MTKKIFKIIALFLILCTLAFAGCQSASSTEAAMEEDTTTDQKTTEETEEIVEQEPVEIAFWYPYGEGSWTGDFLAAKIAEFNESKTLITVVGQSYDSYTAIIEALQRATAAEDLPGIATIGYGFDEYIVNSGIATPINDLMGDDADAYLGDFFPSLIDVTTFDGKTYGVPLALSVAEIFYHSDVFENAGLDPNDPPKTWEELLAAAETIHDELGIYGLTFALDDPWTFESTVRSNGGAYLDAAGESALNSEINIAALTDWGNGAADGSILYNADFFETLQSFGAQEVAMFATSSYGTLIYQEIAPLVKAMPWPAAEGNTAQSPAGGNSLYVLGNSDAERKAAAEFITFLTNAEANAEWAMNSGYLPTRNESLTAMGDFITGFDNYQIAINGIENVVAPTQFGTSTLEANQIIMTAIESVMLGAESAESALGTADQAIVELLSE